MPLLQKDTYASVEIPELEEWNPDDIKLDGTIVAIGKRRTGKSWAFRNIMHLMRDQRDEARAAYQSALTKLDDMIKAEGEAASLAQQGYRSVIEIKLDAVGGKQ